jgi:adenine-specific DNA-methyltransferase
MDELQKHETHLQLVCSLASAHVPDSCKVYTPPELAYNMASALGDEPGSVWLEPSFGRGSFLRGLSRLGVSRDRVIAVDIDGETCEEDNLATTLRGIDFLSWSRSHERAFDRIIGNPPYVALERLPVHIQDAAISMCWGGITSLNLNGNLWAAFLIASLRLLRVRGNLSFVLPAAWDYADYAAELREKLPRYFQRFAIHRSQESLFRDVQEGCVVVQGFNFGFGSAANRAQRFEYKTAQELEDGLSAVASKRRAAQKRFAHIVRTTTVSSECVFQVRLGGVTGDASFFLFTENKRKELGISRGACRPVLSKAKHLRSAITDRKNWKELLDSNERVWLFDPQPNDLKERSIVRHLQKPPDQGGCNREARWVSSRIPWYRVEMPDPIDGFMSGTASIGPWICLRSMRRLGATNTLYTVRFVNRNLTLDEQASWCISLLTSQVRRQLAKRVRVYAGGMHKYEPSALIGLYLPQPKASRGAERAYSECLSLFLAGKNKAALRYADEWIES